MNTSVCSFEHDCDNTATWYAWLPGSGIVAELCGDHVILIQTEQPDVEVVQISTLADVTCSACGEPIWLAHPQPHATGGPCPFCQTDAADHAACSCPALEGFLVALEEATAS